MSRLLARRTSALAAALGLALAVVAPSAQAVPSPTIGLYGAADPTYDGVFRQSLAIMGLTSVGVAPAPSAIAWLLNQQCANGAFEGYRSNLAAPCSAPDAVNFTGPDTNSTAMGALAFMSLLSDAGTRAMNAKTRASVVNGAVKAVQWLGNQQNKDGGWPWTTGGASDANSTGLALAALLSQAPNEAFPAYTKGMRYLGTLASSCSAGGGLAYQAGGPANALATTQSLIGLSGSLPVAGPRTLSPKAPCGNSAKAKAASYVAAALAKDGTIPSAMGDGPDYSTTAEAVLGLVSAQQGRGAVAKGTAALKSAAQAFSTHSGGPDAGALGLLLLVAEATGSSPTSFGGVNLPRTLAASIRK